MQRSISIKWKFFAVSLAIIVIPVVFLGTIVYQFYRHETLTNVRKTLASVVAGWQSFTDIYSEQTKRIRKLERSFIEKRLTSVVLDARGLIEFYDENFMAEDHDSRFGALLDRLASVKIGQNGYLFIIDADGKYLLSRGRNFDGVDVVASQPEALAGNYQEIITQSRQLTGRETRAFVYQWEGQDVPEEWKKMAVATYDPGRKLVIVAVAGYSDFRSYALEKSLREDLRRHMFARKMGVRGDVFILNTYGELLFFRDQSKEGGNLYDARDRYGNYWVRDIIKRAVKLRPGESFLTEYAGQDDACGERIAAVAYHPDGRWIIVVDACKKDVLSGLSITGRWIFFMCFLVCLLGALFAFFISFRLTHPLCRLSATVASGDPDAKLPLDSMAFSDEVGTLAAAFEGMRRNLRDKMTELERLREELMTRGERLQHARKLLVRSEKLAAIGQLAAGVAHEINNPLAYVMSNMETLEQYIRNYEEVLQDMEKFERRKDHWHSVADAQRDVTEYFQNLMDTGFERVRWDAKNIVPELRDGLNRVRRIVSDLRMYTHAEDSYRGEVNVEDVLEQVITIVWNQVKSRAELVREYSKTPPIRCHVQRIGQVFMNIILNAAQASEDGKGTIKLKTYADDRWVYVEVADTGVGIPEENMARIFEPFFTTRPVGEGSGLGLSTSYEIVKKHDGDIRVMSEVGKGSVFTVVLPQRDSAWNGVTV